MHTCIICVPYHTHRLGIQPSTSAMSAVRRSAGNPLFAKRRGMAVYLATTPEILVIDKGLLLSKRGLYFEPGFAAWHFAVDHDEFVFVMGQSKAGYSEFVDIDRG